MEDSQEMDLDEEATLAQTPPQEQQEAAEDHADQANANANREAEAAAPSPAPECHPDMDLQKYKANLAEIKKQGVKNHASSAAMYSSYDADFGRIALRYYKKQMQKNAMAKALGGIRGRPSGNRAFPPAAVTAKTLKNFVCEMERASAAAAAASGGTAPTRKRKMF